MYELSIVALKTNLGAKNNVDILSYISVGQEFRHGSVGLWVRATQSCNQGVSKAVLSSLDLTRENPLLR